MVAMPLKTRTIRVAALWCIALACGTFAMTSAPAGAQSAEGARLAASRASFDELDATYAQKKSACDTIQDGLAAYIGPINDPTAPRDRACAAYAAPGVARADWRRCSESFYDDYEIKRAAFRRCFSEVGKIADERVSLYRDIVAIEGKMRSAALGRAPGVPASAGAPGWFGVVTSSVGKRVARERGLGSTNGAYVKKALEHSPAQKAGIQRGDIITGLGDREIIRRSDLTRVTDGLTAGQILPVRLLRDGREQTLYVAIEPRR